MILETLRWMPSSPPGHLRCSRGIHAGVYGLIYSERLVIVPETSFMDALTETDFLRVRFFVEQGSVLRFVVQYEAIIAGQSHLK